MPVSSFRVLSTQDERQYQSKTLNLTPFIGHHLKSRANLYATLCSHTQVLQISSNFFSPAPLPSLPTIPPVSADIMEKATFLVFEEKMWRSQEGHSTADRVATSRWRRRARERACGELCWHITLFFQARFCHLFCISFPPPCSSLPTHTPMHCWPVISSVCPSALSCFPQSPPSVLQSAVCCYSGDWKN